MFLPKDIFLLQDWVLRDIYNFLSCHLFNFIEISIFKMSEFQNTQFITFQNSGSEQPALDEMLAQNYSRRVKHIGFKLQQSLGFFDSPINTLLWKFGCESKNLYSF